jgi:hypothetical protein
MQEWQRPATLLCWYHGGPAHQNSGCAAEDLRAPPGWGRPLRRHRLGDGRAARVKVPRLYRYLASDAMAVPPPRRPVQEHALTRLNGVCAHGWWSASYVSGCPLAASRTASTRQMPIGKAVPA